jgi:hypothetical protein
MTPISLVGRFLIMMGVMLAVVGVIITLGGRLPQLPGNIVIDHPHVKVYFPLGTMILVSIVLTIILNVFIRR